VITENLIVTASFFFAGLERRNPCGKCSWSQCGCPRCLTVPQNSCCTEQRHLLPLVLLTLLNATACQVSTQLLHLPHRTSRRTWGAASHRIWTCCVYRLHKRMCSASSRSRHPTPRSRFLQHCETLQWRDVPWYVQTHIKVGTHL
jgi:hypothetical protein